MSAVIAVAAALGLVGLGMLVSPEMSRLRARLRQRKEVQVQAPPAPPDTPSERPRLHVIHGDGGTVVPFRPRQTHAINASTSPPGGDGPDAA